MAEISPTRPLPMPATRPAPRRATGSQVPPILLYVILGIFALNVFDAYATIFWLELELAREANPLMAWLLDYHPVWFVIGKLTLVGSGCLVLWRYRRRRLARAGAYLAFALYATLAGFHFGAAVVL